MPRIRDLSFQQQLSLVIVMTSALVLSLAGVFLVVYEWQAYRARLVSEAVTVGQIASVGSTAALMFDDQVAADEVLQALQKDARVRSAALFGEGGVVISSFSRGSTDDRSLVLEPQPAGQRYSRSTLLITQEVLMEGERIGLLQIAFDASGMKQRLADFSFAVLIGLVVSIAVAAGISTVARRRLTAPILGLAEAARRLSTQRDYTVRVPEVPGRELNALTRAFNDMVGQIEIRESRLQAARVELEHKVEQLAEEMRVRQEAQKALRDREDQLRQSQKMEAVGMLAGGVAHDFNNILTAIRGFGELALARKEPDCRCEKHLREMIKASDRAAALTRQLLAFSRKQVMTARVLDLNQVVSNLEKMLRRVIGEDVELVCYLDRNAGLVRADPGQLEQILVNLAVNARDAMPHGGTVMIETRIVELDETWAGRHADLRPGAHVLLAVSDTGTGMTPEVRARIFEPFFTTKERGKGTGLGLSTVYGIVRQSGGQIDVYSEPNQGTTFKIFLPICHDSAEKPETLARASVGAGGRETILLVEDEDQIRQVTAEILGAHGYRVLDAANGKGALDLLAGISDPIDLLLTDVIMPGMNGRELSAQVVRMRPGTRVLFMSGYTDGAIVHNGVLDPDTPFLPKPFSMEQLLGRVRETLDDELRRAA